jgi:hypothetical protein
MTTLPIGSKSKTHLKQDALKVLQNTQGQELFTNVMRFVPVYDEKKQNFMTFDTYARSFIGSEQRSDNAPIDIDPVGAGMRIFFDPSPDTINTMLGLTNNKGQSSTGSSNATSTVKQPDEAPGNKYNIQELELLSDLK